MYSHDRIRTPTLPLIFLGILLWIGSIPLCLADAKRSKAARARCAISFAGVPEKDFTPASELQTIVGDLIQPFPLPPKASSMESVSATLDELEKFIARGPARSPEKAIALSRTLLNHYGYRTSEPFLTKGGGKFFVELLEGPPGTSAAKVIASHRRRGVPILMGTGPTGSDLAATLSRGRGILLSPKHLVLGEDILSTSLLHEARHVHHYRDMLAGIASPYDAQLMSNGKEKLTRIAEYPMGFSFQELSTHEKDSKLLYTFVPSPSRVPRSSLRQAKERAVREFAQEIVEISTRALDWANSTSRSGTTIKSYARLDPMLDRIIVLNLPYTAPNGQKTTFKVWLPELDKTVLASYSEDQLRGALTHKLLWMKANAEKKLKASP